MEVRKKNFYDGLLAGIGLQAWWISWWEEMNKKILTSL